MNCAVMTNWLALQPGNKTSAKTQYLSLFFSMERHCFTLLTIIIILVVFPICFIYLLSSNIRCR
jgi:hypothetical protein